MIRIERTSPSHHNNKKEKSCAAAAAAADNANAVAIMSQSCVMKRTIHN